MDPEALFDPDPPPLWREGLEAVYAGRVLQVRGGAAARTLGEELRARVRESFPDAPTVQRGLSGRERFARLSALREEVFEDELLRLLARELVAALGLPLERVIMDRLRLRCVEGGAHRRPRAAHAYHLHRDCWYGDPAAQVNLWMALWDAPASRGMLFHPAHWRRPVANSSERFDLGEWRTLGGFQRPHPDKHYPTALAPPEDEPRGVDVPRDGLLIFCGSHLHGTRRHEDAAARWSAELRLFLPQDAARVRAPDDSSRGRDLGERLRCSDLRPPGSG